MQIIDLGTDPTNWFMPSIGNPALPPGMLKIRILRGKGMEPFNE
jgi:hypothetical protein